MRGYSPAMAQEALREIEKIEAMESYYKQFDSFLDLLVAQVEERVADQLRKEELKELGENFRDASGANDA